MRRRPLRARRVATGTATTVRSPRTRPPTPEDWTRGGLRLLFVRSERVARERTDGASIVCACGIPRRPRLASARRSFWKIVSASFVRARDHDQVYSRVTRRFRVWLARLAFRYSVSARHVSRFETRLARFIRRGVPTFETLRAGFLPPASRSSEALRTQTRLHGLPSSPSSRFRGRCGRGRRAPP